MTDVSYSNWATTGIIVVIAVFAAYNCWRDLKHMDRTKGGQR